MKKSQFFAIFNGLLKTLSATLVGLFLSVTGWAYDLNVTYQCPGGAVGSFTTASGATFPTVASKCAIGQELAYWTCIEQQISDMPIGSDTENSSFSGRVIKEGWTVNVNSNITLYCTPSLAVQGLDSNWYTDTFWLAPDLSYPNQNRVYMVCRVSALPTTTSSKSILACRKRAGLIEAQKSAGSAYGNTFWVTKNGASLVDLLNSNDNKSIISTFPVGGVSSLIGTLTDNPGFQYFYNKTSTVDQRMWGYEISFKCSENDTTPFARIVWPGNNGSTTPALSDSLKAAVAAKARTTCGSAFNMTNRQMWCNGYATNPKAGTGSNGLVYIRDGESVYFPNGGDCFFPITCEAGTYLPANSSTCAVCPQHSYCEGGSFTQSTSSDQGIKSCSTETSGKFPRTYSCYESNSYGNCIKGASSISQCHASVSFQANADNVTFGGNSFEYKNVSVFYREDASVYAQTCAATQAGAGSDTYWCYRTNNNFYITTTPNIQRTGYNLNGWKKCTYNESGPTNCSSTNITTSAANSTSPYGPANANATLFNSSDLQNGILYLYADWEPIVYTITLNKYNGTGGTNGPIYEHYGVGFYDNPSLTGTAITSITPPERSGYNFKGYYYSGFENDGSGHFTMSNEFVSIPNTGDLTNRETLFSTNTTLYARWIKSCAGSEHSSCNLDCINDDIQSSCYYITSCDSGYLMTSGGGTYNPQCELATCNVTNGTGVPTISYDTNKVTCAVTCNSGYSQDGTSGGATNFSVTGNANVAVVNANCNAIDYPITYDSDGQNLPAGVTNPPTYTAADNVQLNNPIKDGYGFAGWCRYDSVQQTGGDSCTITDTNYVSPQTNPATIIAIAAGSTGAKWFYSKWGAVNYNVIYDCGTGATGTPPPTTLQTFGTTFTVANTDGANCSKTGHHFTGWACKYLDGTDGAPNTGLTNNTTYNVAVDAQCTATWDVNTIYLDWNNDNGITGTNGAPSCQYGGTINPVQTVSKNGYNFAGWDVVNEPGRGIIEDKQ